jgi:hypothetical protein
MLSGLLGSPYMMVGVVFQIMCAVHCIKTGRPWYWFWIIVIFSVLGALAYFLVEIVPHMGGSRAVRQTNRAITNIVDPDRDLRQKGANFAISNNVETTCHYAAQLVQKGKFAEAIGIYQNARKGMFMHDPLLLRGLAEAYRAMGRHAEASTVLKELLEHHPDHKAGDMHLLYAIVLEADNRTQEAEAEYKKLIVSYAGPEPKCRYARLLQSLGAQSEALELYREVELVATNAPRHYQRLHKEWINMARNELKLAEQRSKTAAASAPGTSTN